MYCSHKVFSSRNSLFRVVEILSIIFFLKLDIVLFSYLITVWFLTTSEEKVLYFFCCFSVTRINFVTIIIISIRLTFRLETRNGLSSLQMFFYNFCKCYWHSNFFAFYTFFCFLEFCLEDYILGSFFICTISFNVLFLRLYFIFGRAWWFVVSWCNEIKFSKLFAFFSNVKVALFKVFIVPVTYHMWLQFL